MIWLLMWSTAIGWNCWHVRWVAIATTERKKRAFYALLIRSGVMTYVQPHPPVRPSVLLVLEDTTSVVPARRAPEASRTVINTHIRRCGYVAVRTKFCSRWESERQGVPVPTPARAHSMRADVVRTYVEWKWEYNIKNKESINNNNNILLYIIIILNN